MSNLQLMAICRVRELINEAHLFSQQERSWRETPLTTVEKETLNQKRIRCLELADQWLVAVAELDCMIGVYPASTPNKEMGGGE